MPINPPGRRLAISMQMPLTLSTVVPGAGEQQFGMGSGAIKEIVKAQ